MAKKIHCHQFAGYLQWPHFSKRKTSVHSHSFPSIWRNSAFSSRSSWHCCTCSRNSSSSALTSSRSACMAASWHANCCAVGSACFSHAKKWCYLVLVGKRLFNPSSTNKNDTLPLVSLQWGKEKSWGYSSKLSQLLLRIPSNWETNSNLKTHHCFVSLSLWRCEPLRW